MILTVDIGNSRIKWALWQSEKIVDRGVAQYKKDKPVSGFDQLFSVLEKPFRVFAVCVAGEQMQRSLSEWVMRHWQLEIQYLKTKKQYKNIINAYQQPEQHGADRWAALVAACQNFPDTSLCIISAGTAITFDFVEKNGQHLGGYILPSYATMHVALQADAMNVSSTFDLQFHQQCVPDNTDDAVNQGLHILLQAGIRELCQLAQNRMNGPVKIILTGGFAPVILAYPDMPVMQHEPDLIMQGLYNIMAQQENGVER